MKSWCTFIIIITSLIVFCTCSSCRTVQKSRTATESVAISKLERTTDSAAEAELKRMIARLHEDFVFTIRDITIEEDSSGLKLGHISEKIMQHSKESSSDSISSKLQSLTHDNKTDSAASVKNDVSEDIHKEPINPRTVVAAILLILIVVVLIKIS